MQAVADRFIHLIVRRDNPFFEVGRIRRDFALSLPDHAPLVINERCCKDASQPAADTANLPQLRGTLERLQGKPLKQVFSFRFVVDALIQEQEKLLARLYEGPANGRVRRLRRLQLTFFSLRLICVPVFRHCRLSTHTIYVIWTLLG